MSLMWRTLRARTGIFGTSRLPIRLHAQAQREAMNIQNVRILEPKTRFSHVVVGVCSVITCFIIAEQWVLNPLADATKSIVEGLDEQTKKELMDESGESSLFIPFPLTITQVPGVAYRGRDSEWQEFIKISKDTALTKKIRDDLAGYVKSTCESSLSLKARCGNGMKIRRSWLDIDFPLVAPPTFERSGIEIGDGFVAWSTMPVDSAAVFRIRSVLWPAAPALAAFAFCKVYFLHSVEKAKRIVGIQPKTDIFQFDSVSSKISRRGGDPNKQASIPKDPFSATSLRELEGTEAKGQDKESSSTSGSDPVQNVENKQRRPVKLSQGTSDILRQHAGTTESQLILTTALLAAQLTWALNKASPRKYPERGTILLTGLVEIDSPKALLTLDVKAAWDPKTKDFDKEASIIAIKRLQMKKQGPLGGP